MEHKKKDNLPKKSTYRKLGFDRFAFGSHMYIFLNMVRRYYAHLFTFHFRSFLLLQDEVINT